MTAQVDHWRCFIQNSFDCTQVLQSSGFGSSPRPGVVTTLFLILLVGGHGYQTTSITVAITGAHNIST